MYIEYFPTPLFISVIVVYSRRFDLFCTFHFEYIILSLLMILSLVGYHWYHNLFLHLHANEQSTVHLMHRLWLSVPWTNSVFFLQILIDQCYLCQCRDHLFNRCQLKYITGSMSSILLLYCTPTTCWQIDHLSMFSWKSSKTIMQLSCHQHKSSKCEYTCNIDLLPDSKVHGANMGPTWVLSASDGPHVGPKNLALGVVPVSYLESTNSASENPQ